MDYQPNQAVLTKLPRITFVAVVGPTAVGKTTLLNAAAARCPAIHQVISTTTRQPRPNEKDGEDFHFRSQQEMETRIAAGEYVLAVSPSSNGDYYASAPEDYADEGIAAMAVMADVVPAFRTLPFKVVRTIFVLPPSWEIWQQRIAEHNFSPEALEKRMQEAGRSLRFAIDDQNLIFVINDDLAQSTLDFTQAALGAESYTNQFTSRDLAAQLLKELQNR
jgi:guanylate kinase